MFGEKIIAGIDEAGRGPLAGPVTAACVVYKPGYENSQITDSKKLSHKKREELYGEIIANSLAYSIVAVGPRRIESLNIREASREAMLLAVLRVQRILNSSPTFMPLHLLIDGNVPLRTEISQETIIKGDEKISQIGAASILAKVYRDRIMEMLDLQYPKYNLAKHKGYPTKDHRESISLQGPSRIHRKTFAGVREYL